MKRKAKPRIAFLREQAGLTQLELSRLVGVTESTIQNWESGRTGTDNIERVIKFCKALNCKVEDLIEYKDAPEAEAKPVSLQEIQALLGTEQEITSRHGEAVKQRHEEGESEQVGEWGIQR